MVDRRNLNRFYTYLLINIINKLVNLVNRNLDRFNLEYINSPTFFPNKALVKDLKYPEGADPSSQFVLKKPLVVNVGSIKGSIEGNESGGSYPYRQGGLLILKLTEPTTFSTAMPLEKLVKQRN